MVSVGERAARAEAYGDLRLKRYVSPLYRKNRRVLRRMYEANLLPCAYCGLPIDFSAPPDAPLSFTVDHVIPVAAGGSDMMDNLVGAHKACNRAKSDHLATQVKESTQVKPTKRWW